MKFYKQTAVEEAEKVAPEMTAERKGKEVPVDKLLEP